MAALAAMLRERAVDFTCVLYLRNVIPHALSSYHQEVKRGLYSGTF